MESESISETSERGRQNPFPLDQLLALDDNDSSSCLRSVANYEKLNPQALACSHLLQNGSSLGALAGSNGVAVFRVSKPETPIMMLNYAFTNQAISSLAFQETDSLLLASSRGTGILVWDASGHSLSPLWGRLGMEGFSDVAKPIVSLSWAQRETSFIGGTTESSACIWDLRQRPFRPQIRFGLNQNSDTSPYVQIACSDQEDCALLNGSGTMFVFDTRMTSESRDPSPLCSFQAFHDTAFGLAAMSRNAGLEWVTYGKDHSNRDTVVKIWARGQPNEDAVDADDYWFADSSHDRTSTTPIAPGYSLSGRCSIPHLNCARPCPHPLTDKIVSVAVECDIDGQATNTWNACLWECRPLQQSYELVKKSGIVGGADVESLFESRKETVPRGDVAGSEVALSVDSWKGDLVSLVVCTLTSNGFVSVHEIPDSITDGETQQIEKLRLRYQNQNEDISSRHLETDTSVATRDAAVSWNDQSHNKPALQKRRSIESPAGKEVPPKRTIQASGPPYHGSSTVEGTEPDWPRGKVTVEAADFNSEETSAVLQDLKRESIPCPRLCGASFAPGGGGLVCLRNGDILKVWSWWEQSHKINLESTGFRHNAKETKATSMTDTTASRFPRTLQQLDDMASAAKGAQWGSKGDSCASSDAHMNEEDSLFEEASLDSSEDDPGQEEEAIDLYEQYFGSSPQTSVFESHDDTSQAYRTKVESFDGLNEKSEGHNFGVLAPVVSVSHAYDKLVLQGQCLGLAKCLLLGPLPANGKCSLSKPKRITIENESGVLVDGVYALRKTYLDPQMQKHMQDVSQTCSHNAGVCEEFGEKEKAKVWRLLQKLIIMHQSERSCSRGMDNNAVLSHLLKRLITFNVRTGDAQMMASVACVLRVNESSGYPDLVPNKMKQLLYPFIRVYANMLYLWGMLLTRAEILKHCSQHSTQDWNSKFELATRYTCPSCRKPLAAGANVCKDCNDSVSRCSICELVIRGAFTVCIRCGHGGHIKHITDWFSAVSECPTGCGCNCASHLISMSVDQ